MDVKTTQNEDKDTETLDFDGLDVSAMLEADDTSDEGDGQGEATDKEAESQGEAEPDKDAGAEAQAKPHNVDKAVQNLQQEFGNTKRALEEIRQMVQDIAAAKAPGNADQKAEQADDLTKAIEELDDDGVVDGRTAKRLLAEVKRLRDGTSDVKAFEAHIEKVRTELTQEMRRIAHAPEQKQAVIAEIGKSYGVDGAKVLDEVTKQLRKDVAELELTPAQAAKRANLLVKEVATRMAAQKKGAPAKSKTSGDTHESGAATEFEGSSGQPADGKVDFDNLDISQFVST